MGTHMSANAITPATAANSTIAKMTNMQPTASRPTPSTAVSFCGGCQGGGNGWVMPTTIAPAIGARHGLGKELQASSRAAQRLAPH